MSRELTKRVLTSLSPFSSYGVLWSFLWDWSALVYPCVQDPGVVYRCGVDEQMKFPSTRIRFGHHLRYTNVWQNVYHTVLSFPTRFRFSEQDNISPFPIAFIPRIDRRYSFQRESRCHVGSEVWHWCLCTCISVPLDRTEWRGGFPGVVQSNPM